ncbi:hypothetical protein BGZ73_006877 [Actinomortierella ambigua]|nr:hypothetical protein BGZ73_006877 [Actinomortierella ambigua]
MARIKVDDIAPDKEYKGLSYSWELKPLERNSHSFEIRNSATGLSIVGFDIDNDRLAATPGKGSTWEIIQYHGERYVIKLAGTQLVWTFERDVTGGHNAGNVRLRPYSEETHGQVWVFKVDHPHHIPDDEIWMM